MKKRSIRDIAIEILRDWKKPHYAAAPYLNAMLHLNDINDRYGYDSGQMVVAYFLSNSGTWKGETARRIKNELREMLN